MNCLIHFFITPPSTSPSVSSYWTPAPWQHPVTAPWQHPVTGLSPAPDPVTAQNLALGGWSRCIPSSALR